MRHLLNQIRSSNLLFQYRNVTGRICHVCQNRHASKLKNVPLLTELTGCNTKTAYEILRKNNTFAKMDQERIRKAAAVIERLGFKKEDLTYCVEILSKHPLTIETHFMVLEEGGFLKEKLTPVGIYRYLTFVRKEIKALKLFGLIANNCDVTQHFSSYAMMPKSVEVYSCGDNATFMEAQSQVMEALLCWRLSLSKEDMKKLKKMYSMVRHRSIRMAKRNLDILENDIGFTKKKICKHAYLIFSDADNTVNMLNTIPKLGGVDLTRALHAFPKILIAPTDSVLKIQRYLKEFSIPDEAVSKVLNIFTLAPESVYLRLKQMYQVPHFAALIHHPLNLQLVLHQRKASRRLDLLSKLNIKCASLHVLSTGDNMFYRYAERGEDRTRGDDVTVFISNELGVERKEVRTKLQRHPYWYNVPLVTIKENLDYLRTEKFTNDNIFNNLQLLLYPKVLIMQELNVLETRPGVEYCRPAEGARVRKETVLPLVQYFVEQQHNFSGDGIWLQHESKK